MQSINKTQSGQNFVEFRADHLHLVAYSLSWLYWSYGPAGPKLRCDFIFHSTIPENLNKIEHVVFATGPFT